MKRGLGLLRGRETQGYLFKFYSCKIRAGNKEKYISGFHANLFELAARFLMNLQQVTRTDIFFNENCKFLVLNEA